MNIIGRVHRNRNEFRKQGKQEVSRKEASKKVTSPYNLYYNNYYKSLENISEEKQSANCSSGKKENQRYSSSFVGNVTNHTLSVDKEFNEVVGNNSKAKTISSVHEDEDITLCWIETTTIKENKTVRPPKRLVIREYTISFENSATIPDKYLECKKLEGELTTNDKEIGKTALFEIIDEDTKVSRVVNFTSVSHVGDIIVWQHKRVKCGVGPVVSKNIVEWNDGSKNPKKRVEIKVSPKLHQLTAKTEEELCTESSEEGNEKGNRHTTTESCEESGACEVTTKSDDILIKSNKEISEEKITKSSKNEASSESESKDLSTSIGITKPPLSTEEIFNDTHTVPKITREDILNCEEDSLDPACTTQRNITHSSSSIELFTESDATEATTKAISKTRDILTPIVHKKTKKETSSKKKLWKKPISSESSEEERVVTEETTLLTSTTEILKSSEELASQSTDKESVTTSENVDYDNSAVSTAETSVTISSSETEEKEHSTTEEDKEYTSVELTSEELNKIDHVPSSSISTITSEEYSAEQVTTTVSPYGFTEFVKESEKFSKSLNKLSEPSIESISESVTARLATTTSSSSAEIKPTALSSTVSNRLDYSCENSEDCLYVSSSESCDESQENCGSVTVTSCESGMCSGEIDEDQSRSDVVFLPTKNQPSVATDSQSSEKSATIEIQHTTVASVATTILTVQEAENISTAIDNADAHRRSTTTSTPQHKLTLKVKVLLQHINQEEEKLNLVEVEKNLSLDENSAEDDHFDLLEQLKSLNDSINRDTLSALLNCTILGNLTKKSNLISTQSNHDIDDSYEELEPTNPSAFEELISEQSTSGRDLAENEDSQYPEYNEENEVSSRRRRRRSLDDNKLGDLSELDAFNKNLSNPSNESSVSVNSLNVSELQNIHLTKETIHPSTTTSNPEEGTSDAAYVENERNVTKEGNDSVAFSTINDNDTDSSSTLGYQDVNVTKEIIQLSTTTNNPEEGTSDAVRTENGNDTTTEIVLSTVSSANENVYNETETEVLRQILPGIQEDVSVGLQHVVSELTQNNPTFVNDLKKIIQTNLLNIIADPKDNRIHSRARRAAGEEVGHWSNERIKEAPMGGNLRSFIEFTLYKVLP
ncbi:unnamed protein product [Lasius platythorax]